MARPKPRGIIPALSTVTTKKGDLDDEGLRSIVRHNLKWGVHAVAVSIVAGEFYKFSDEERKRCYEIVVDEANGKVPVWAGVSHLGTEPAVQLARHAKDIGADGIIAMPALVGREAGLALFDHFSTILERVDIHLMIQDAEDFNGINITSNLYARLAKEHDNFVSVKVEGERTLEKIQEIKNFLGERLTIIGGMAARLLLEELRLGAHGNIPDACLTDLLVEAFESYTTGRFSRAKAIFSRYKPWVDFVTLHASSAFEVEKETLRLRGVVESSQTRSPHIALSEEAKVELKNVLKRMGLLARR